MTTTYRRVDLSEFEGHTPGSLRVCAGSKRHVQVDGIVKPVDCGNASLAELFAAAPDMAAELAALREQVRTLREALGYIESEAWGRDTMVSGIRRRIVDRASAAMSATAPAGGAE